MSKNLNEKVKRFRISPFNSVLHIVVSNDPYESFSKRRIPGEVPEHAEAFVWRSDCSANIFMFLRHTASPSTVAHESLHVVASVMKQHHVEFEEEVWAYHIGDIVDRVTDMFMPKRAKRKPQTRKTVATGAAPSSRQIARK